MDNQAGFNANWKFICERCGAAIESDQKMVRVWFTTEKVIRGNITEIQAEFTDFLCLPCVAAMIGGKVDGENPDPVEPMLRELAKLPGKRRPRKRVQREKGGNVKNALDRQASIYFDLGKYFMGKQDYEFAVNALTKAIELNPKNARFYDVRGIARGRRYEYDDAIADFTRAIGIDAAFAGAYNNRALSYYKMEMFDEAMKDYDIAIALSPETGVFYSNRGLVYYHKGEVARAILDYTSAIDLDSTEPEFYNNRGEACASSGNYEEAISDFNRALAVNPNYAEAYANRVLALSLNKKTM